MTCPCMFTFIVDNWFLAVLNCWSRDIAFWLEVVLWQTETRLASGSGVWVIWKTDASTGRLPEMGSCKRHPNSAVSWLKQKQKTNQFEIGNWMLFSWWHWKWNASKDHIRQPSRSTWHASGGATPYHSKFSKNWIITKIEMKLPKTKNVVRQKQKNAYKSIDALTSKLGI